MAVQRVEGDTTIVDHMLEYDGGSIVQRRGVVAKRVYPPCQWSEHRSPRLEKDVETDVYRTILRAVVARDAECIAGVEGAHFIVSPDGGRGAGMAQLVEEALGEAVHVPPFIQCPQLFAADTQVQHGHDRCVERNLDDGRQQAPMRG